MSTYALPDDAYINERAGNLIKFFTSFVNRHKKGFVIDVTICMHTLRDCILRVHQRAHYFKTFHDMPEGPSEVKRVSLYCFWILKYKPFTLYFGDPPSHFEQGDDLGEWKWKEKYFLERFCLYFFLHIVGETHNVARKIPLSDKGIVDFVYSLRHHDITKEVLTVIFEMVEDVIKLGHKTVPQPVIFK